MVGVWHARMFLRGWAPACWFALCVQVRVLPGCPKTRMACKRSIAPQYSCAMPCAPHPPPRRALAFWLQAEIASRDRKLSELSTRAEQAEAAAREAQHVAAKLEEDLTRTRGSLEVRCGRWLARTC